MEYKIKMDLHDSHDLLLQLVSQCAPVLCGVKSANLFQISEELESIVEQEFPWRGLELELLMKKKRRDTFLLYQRDPLLCLLSQRQIQEFLEERGYSKDWTIKRILHEIAQRYENHMDRRTEFPHELGILLGYPIWDVRGFIENNGQNFLYCGYWKVYENLEEALQTFACYDQARERLENIPIIKARMQSTNGRVN